MIVNIVDDDVRNECRRVIVEELKTCLRSNIDKHLEQMLTSKITRHYDKSASETVAKTLKDHLEIETTIFLRHELVKQESTMRKIFDEHLEKVLSELSVNSYIKQVLDEKIEEMIERKIKQFMKTSFQIEIKER